MACTCPPLSRPKAIVILFDDLSITIRCTRCTLFLLSSPVAIEITDVRVRQGAR